MRKSLILKLIGSFFISLAFLPLVSVFASAASESITDFNSQIVAHKDGTFDVTETIKYDFGTSEKRGIYRDIPKVSKVGDLYRVIEIEFLQILHDGQNEQYSVNETQDKVSVKIGQAAKTITGVHLYKISYSVKNGSGSNYKDHDEIYWNVTGNEWQVSILSASITLKTDFGVSENKIACFTGSFGASDKDCLVQESFPATIKTAKPLAPGEGLTAVWGFPVNTFPKSLLQKETPNVTGVKISPFFGIFLLLGVALFYFILPLLILIWYLKNKRKERFGSPVPNFDFPQDGEEKRLTPAEAGTIDTAKLEKDDVVATIFDLAIRKYIKLEQVQKSKEFFIKKLKSYGDVAPLEKVLLDRLFRDVESVEVGSLKKDFYETFQDMDREVFISLVKRGYYSKNPKTQRGLLLAGTITAAVTFNWFLAAVLFLLYKKLIGRTALGDKIDYQIDGLKLFLKNMSRNYKWQVDQLYIVEKMIPYAMALGYIDKFMEQLKIIYPDYKPDWYSGNLAFYAVSNNMFSSMSSGLTTSAPSSSSGFGGGGFSGGGGGGGGGGSW